MCTKPVQQDICTKTIIEEKPLQHEQHECFLCNKNMREVIHLDCQHAFHASCILKWWRTKQDTLTCPLCRQKSYGCFIELDKRTNKMIGYYRQDNDDAKVILLRNSDIDEESEQSIDIKSIIDIGGRQLALLGYLLCKEL